MRSRFFWLIIAVGLAGFAFLQLRQEAPRAQQTPARAGWRQTAPGIEVRMLGDTQTGVIAVRVDPERCRIRVVDAHKGKPRQGASAGQVCPRDGAAINASFFDEALSPIGLLIADEKKIRPLRDDNGWGVFRLRNGRPEIVSAAGCRLQGVTQAVECKPRLVINGKVPTFKAQAPSFRSAVGVDSQGRLLLIASRGLYTLEQWALLCRDDLYCVNALNLDGGPSTQLTVRGKYPHAIPGGWNVAVLMTAAPK
jgi:uncharacterized protein YigE (DUF2233 family)